MTRYWCTFSKKRNTWHRQLYIQVSLSIYNTWTQLPAKIYKHLYLILILNIANITENVTILCSRLAQFLKIYVWLAGGGIISHYIIECFFFKYDIVWCDQLVIWRLFLSIQVMYFGYADLSVAPLKFDVAVRTTRAKRCIIYKKIINFYDNEENLIL
jgi:hypothetical protein